MHLEYTTGMGCRLPARLGPLPIFWPYGPDRLRGGRIDLLPPRFRASARDWPWLPPLYRAALVAVDGFEMLADDQHTGRL